MFMSTKNDTGAGQVLEFLSLQVLQQNIWPKRTQTRSRNAELQIAGRMTLALVRSHAHTTTVYIRQHNTIYELPSTFFLNIILPSKLGPRFFFLGSAGTPSWRSSGNTG